VERGFPATVRGRSRRLWRKEHVENQHVKEIQNMKKPNIVYILADDMGYGDLSCLNLESKIRTENLDRVASGGMSFTDAHSSSAVCTPSRYSILTGRYNWRSELKQGVVFGYSPHVIEAGRETVASMLRARGYTTACIGKWHLGLDWEFNDSENAIPDFTKPVKNGPLDCGFDRFFGISASLDMPPYAYIENDRVTAIPDDCVASNKGKAYWREGLIAPDFRHEDVLPVCTRKSIEFIYEQADAGNPFFLYFPLPAPHTPILPLEKFRGSSGTNEYGDFCLQVDDTVGRIAAVLDEKGISDNTIFIFTSDNGCSPHADFAELATFEHNPSYIFRGHKADIYEGGHRIPLIIKWPEIVPSGSVRDDTVCLVDFMATIADILNIRLPDNTAEDSVSNLSLWKGEAREGSLREATVHHSINGSFSIRKGNWKLEMCPGSGGWSYPRPEECEGLPPIQLYDLSVDIGERRNLYSEKPEIVKELTDLLTSYVKNGRSTPGAPQPNTGVKYWPQLNWLNEKDL
jgi:arylsulfatase A-like enzyme